VSAPASPCRRQPELRFVASATSPPIPNRLDAAVLKSTGFRVTIAEQQWETSMAERDLNKDVDAIKADLEALRKDLASVLETIKGTAKSRAESELDALQKRLNQMASDVQASGRESLRAFEGQIGEKPLVSVAIAFAVGLMIGKLFDHRR
jgi:ElaB/YqjD/DUF883 family membrane-anchored ribosome-binding protein